MKWKKLTQDVPNFDKITQSESLPMVLCKYTLRQNKSMSCFFTAAGRKSYKIKKLLYAGALKPGNSSRMIMLKGTTFISPNHSHLENDACAVIDEG